MSSDLQLGYFDHMAIKPSCPCGIPKKIRAVRWRDGTGKLPALGRPTIWMTVGQGPFVLAVGAGGRDCLDILSLVYPCSPLSPSLWETARYRLKYCLKGPLNPKNNQPTKSKGEPKPKKFSKSQEINNPSKPQIVLDLTYC